MLQLLERFPSACGQLPDDLVRRLSAGAVIVRARAGRTVIALGAASDDVYLVLEGTVRVAVCSVHGSEVILRDEGPGELFGELAALDGELRSASITAVSDCALASFSGAAFREAACATPETALWLARRLTRQIRHLTDKVFEGSTLRVSSRLHCELLRLCVPGEAPGTAVIDPAPTHADLAARIGTHREAVTKELRYLVGRGIVAQARRRLTVLDLPALEQLGRNARGDTGLAGN